MHTTIHEQKFPDNLRGVSDGSVAGTHFYNSATGEAMVPVGVTVQQEGMSSVRIRFPRHYGIGSFVMAADDTMTLNALPTG